MKPSKKTKIQHETINEPNNCSHIAPQTIAYSTPFSYSTLAGSVINQKSILNRVHIISNIASTIATLNAAPKRLEENVQGLLYVNEKVRSLSLPIYSYCRNDASFGATPYLILGKSLSGNVIAVMVDVPRYSASAVHAVKSLCKGPDYLFLTHVDDTADHNKWVIEFPSLKRIFHAGDLGKHNWIGDATLEKVEILLTEKTVGEKLAICDIAGNKLPEKRIQELEEQQFLILHTLGHSPGSISLLFRPRQHRGVLFTGDTLAWTTRGGGHMSSFPRYGNDLVEQADTLRWIMSLADRWDVIAPGHGHPRFYRENETDERKIKELSVAIDELNSY